MTMFTREREVLFEAVQAAGELIERIARDGFQTRDKGYRDPVTTADLEANRLLQKRLLGAFPADGWLSEETRDDRARLAQSRVWIVDPLDGTREFVAKIPEYAVSVALVIDGAPVLGAVHNPATGELCIAERGAGVLLDGEPVTRPVVGERLKLVASRSETRRGQFEPIEPHADIQIVGSIAYKHALVAAGRADAVISLAPKNEWDIAAGVLLVSEAGGTVTDLGGVPLRFNQADTLVGGLIAASDAAYPRARNLAALA